MEWLKRSIGLKIFLLVWLLVLLIPAWRLRAQRQWLAPRMFDKFMFPGDGSMPMLGLRSQGEQEIGRLFPNDATAQMVALHEPEDLSPQNSTQYFQQMAALARRFPKDLTIRSRWLRTAMRFQFPIESTELLADQVKSGTNVTIVGQRPKVYVLPAAMQEEALQNARSGAQAQPNNAFWPWMEVCLNLSLKHDEAAFAALKRAGNCTQFDDGTATQIKERIALMQRVQTTDVFDEEYELWSMLLPHYSRIRAATREMMWQANLALKRGDRQKALQIAGQLQKAAVPLLKNNDYFITRLVGEALCYVAWKQSFVYAGIKTPSEGSTEAEQTAFRQQIVSIFADYARQNGRPDLARSATQLQSHFIEIRLENVFKDDHFDGIAQSMDALARLHWLGAWLMAFAVCGAVVWLLSTGLSRWKYIVPRTRQSAAVISSAFCMGVLGAVLWGLLRIGGAHDNFVQMEPLDLTSPLSSTEFYQGALLLVILMVGLVNLLSLLTNVSWVRPRLEWNGRKVLEVALYLGLVLGVFACALALNTDNLQDTIWGRLWPAPKLWAWGCLLGISVLYFLRTKSASRWPTLLFWAALFGLNCGVGISFIPHDGPFYFVCFGFLAMCLFSLGLLVRLFQNVRDTKTAAPIVGDVVARTRIATATLVMVSTIGYLVLNLASIPTSNHARSLIDEQLNYGEVTFVQKRVATNWLTIMTNAAM